MATNATPRTRLLRTLLKHYHDALSEYNLRGTMQADEQRIVVADYRTARKRLYTELDALDADFAARSLL